MGVRSRSLPFSHIKDGHDEHPENIFRAHLFGPRWQILSDAWINKKIIKRRFFSAETRVNVKSDMLVTY